VNQHASLDEVFEVLNPPLGAAILIGPTQETFHAD
jgi:hypothetical protein